MAKIAIKPTVLFECAITLTESEARALDAMVGYGTDPFLKAFYGHLGQAYMLQHETGLRSLFDSIKSTIPQQLRGIDEARKTLAASTSKS